MTSTELLQKDFDLTIGRLDRILSKLMGWARTIEDMVKEKENVIQVKDMERMMLDDSNIQTLKHHAEDMMACGQSILKRINPNG